MSLQMCEKHWDECVKAIKERGLLHLTSKCIEEAVERTMADMSSHIPTRNYDPLLNLSMMLNFKILESLGNEILEDEETHCPLCLAKENVNKKTPEVWIDVFADQIEMLCLKYHLQG
jgi:hypothetical protein